jgi:hypothetical protein
MKLVPPCADVRGEMHMTPTTNRLAELAAHGPVIVRAPDSMVVCAGPGEPWFGDDEPTDSKLQHPAVTRWLESLVVAPSIPVEELDVDDRIRIVLAALDARAMAGEWSPVAAAEPLA